MRTLKLLSAAIVVAAVAWTTDIYNYSIPLMEGGNQSLAAYQGKKLVIAVLPVQQNASADSMLYSLDTLGAAHAAGLTIIAVPSYEDGFTPEQRNSLQQWYRSKLGSHIVLSDGLYTRKISGSLQASLFAWLTKVEQNESLDTDVEGPGQLFFINSSGRLYGVLTGPAPAGGRAVQKVLQMQ